MSQRWWRDLKSNARKFRDDLTRDGKRRGVPILDGTNHLLAPADPFDGFRRSEPLRRHIGSRMGQRLAHTQDKQNQTYEDAFHDPIR